MSLPDTPLGTRHASLSTCTPLPRVCALEVQLSRLTIVGGVRERSVVTRRGRGKTVCARGAYWALLCSPSTSPLGARLVQLVHMPTPPNRLSAPLAFLSAAVIFLVLSTLRHLIGAPL